MTVNAPITPDVYEHGPVASLVGRYCDAVARFDVDAFSALWTEDAIWYIAGGDDRHGRPAITRLFRSARAPFELCIQETLSSIVDPSGRARWYVRELQWRRDGAASQLIGVYDDVLAGSPDDPRFASRRFSVLYRGPLEASGRLYEASDLGPP